MKKFHVKIIFCQFLHARSSLPNVFPPASRFTIYLIGCSAKECWLMRCRLVLAAGNSYCAMPRASDFERAVFNPSRSTKQLNEKIIFVKRPDPWIIFDVNRVGRSGCVSILYCQKLFGKVLDSLKRLITRGDRNRIWIIEAWCFPGCVVDKSWSCDLISRINFLKIISWTFEFMKWSDMYIQVRKLVVFLICF